jgi:GNAT superfamily N-acetyltransferase
MTSWQIRAFRPDDLEAVIDLLETSAPVDAVTPRSFTENVLLDVNFHADGLRVAVADGCILGVIYAVAAGSPAVPVPSDGGWITLFAVHPDHRGGGIGAALLSEATEWLRGRGAAWVNVFGYPPAYFVPGLDVARYPEAHRLLTAAGFTESYTAVAMDASLAGYSTPEQVHQIRRQREAEGYRFGSAAPGDLPEAIAFASARMAPDWGDVIRNSTLQHGHPERVQLARDPDGTVVGFATYGSYGGIVERFGPFGVDETQRGRKLGEILLHLTMTRMRAEGAHCAWFLWTGEHSPAGHLYLKTGYQITRRFQVMQKSLA